MATINKGVPSKTEQKMSLLRGFIRNYTSHKQSCPRLLAEIKGDTTLPACTCGFFQAMEKLDIEITKLK